MDRHVLDHYVFELRKEDPSVRHVRIQFLPHAVILQPGTGGKITPTQCHRDSCDGALRAYRDVDTGRRFYFCIACHALSGGGFT